MIKTNKTGVYYNLLEDGDKVFYFTYNDINDNKKKKWVKVGKYSDGIREINAFNLRAEQLSEMKHGKDITVIANKKKVNITTYDDLAQIYFNDKNVDKYRINKYELHIKPSIGNKDIKSITKDMIKKILDDVVAKGRANQTVNTIRELTGAIFNHSIKEHNLQLINPCNGVKRLNVDNGRERYLSTDEIKLLKEHFKDNFLLTLFIDLSLQTGGRFETILLVQKKILTLQVELLPFTTQKQKQPTRDFYKTI